MEIHIICKLNMMDQYSIQHYYLIIEVHNLPYLNKMIRINKSSMHTNSNYFHFQQNNYNNYYDILCKYMEAMQMENYLHIVILDKDLSKLEYQGNMSHFIRIHVRMCILTLLLWRKADLYSEELFRSEIILKMWIIIIKRLH